jgi:hypothetical protein
MAPMFTTTLVKALKYMSDAAHVTIPKNKINFGKNRQNALYFLQDLKKNLPQQVAT